MSGRNYPILLIQQPFQLQPDGLMAAVLQHLVLRCDAGQVGLAANTL